MIDEQDSEHEHQYHRPVNPTSTLEKPIKIRFWDRPIPSPMYGWPRDHCMPQEWNTMINEMWEIDPHSKGNLFNHPERPNHSDPDWDINNRLSHIVLMSSIESEGPYEFTAAMYPEAYRRNFLCRTMDIVPELTSEINIAKMVTHNEQ